MKSISAFLFTAVAGICLTAFSQGINPFPEPSAVANITLCSEPDGSCYLIFQENYINVWKLFSNASEDPDPKTRQSFFTFEVALNNGEQVEVVVYKSAEPVGAFKVGEKYYRGCSDALFEEFLDLLQK